MPPDGTTYVRQEFTDSQLIDRSQSAGDRFAFEELVRRHQPKLRYSMRQLTNWDEALADDLAQETFLQAFQKLGTFRGDAKFSSWLYRIGYNIFLQYCRKKKLATEELKDEPPSTQEAGSASTEAVGGADKLHRKLAQAMAKLGHEARSVMHLMLHQQCTQQEISDIMGIPLGSVKTHINRSRPVLQSQLADWRE